MSNLFISMHSNDTVPFYKYNILNIHKQVIINVGGKHVDLVN